MINIKKKFPCKLINNTHKYYDKRYFIIIDDIILILDKNNIIKKYLWDPSTYRRITYS